MPLSIAKVFGDTMHTFVDDTTFDGVTTEYTSDSFNTGEWEHYTLWLEMAKTGVGIAHLITINIEFSPDNETWYECYGGLEVDPSTIPLTLNAGDIGDEANRCYGGTVFGWYFRLHVVALGTTAEKTITLTAKAQFWH